MDGRGFSTKKSKQIKTKNKTAALTEAPFCLTFFTSGSQVNKLRQGRLLRLPWRHFDLLPLTLPRLETSSPTPTPSATPPRARGGASNPLLHAESGRRSMCPHGMRGLGFTGQAACVRAEQLQAVKAAGRPVKHFWLREGKWKP